ncbi:unnamed protein product [Prorocentrum cordatum]|uniref:PPM-type phosphatase domain-containing protein n=1 Tax=Prorocentrum cordatum TaxID=2364126 RepID=A0ABN9QTF2_9DINO|nr:unnamed protein product [Polarella glacialis]
MGRTAGSGAPVAGWSVWDEGPSWHRLGARFDENADPVPDARELPVGIGNKGGVSVGRKADYLAKLEWEFLPDLAASGARGPSAFCAALPDAVFNDGWFTMAELDFQAAVAKLQRHPGPAKDESKLADVLILSLYDDRTFVLSRIGRKVSQRAPYAHAAAALAAPGAAARRATSPRPAQAEAPHAQGSWPADGCRPYVRALAAEKRPPALWLPKSPRPHPGAALQLPLGAVDHARRGGAPAARPKRPSSCSSGVLGALSPPRAGGASSPTLHGWPPEAESQRQATVAGLLRIAGHPAAGAGQQRSPSGPKEDERNAAPRPSRAAARSPSVPGSPWSPHSSAGSSAAGPREPSSRKSSIAGIRRSPRQSVCFPGALPCIYAHAGADRHEKRVSSSPSKRRPSQSSPSENRWPTAPWGFSDGQHLAVATSACQDANPEHRSHMEDELVVADALQVAVGAEGAASDWAFFGVYDGHGGRGAVDACRDQLHQVVAAELQGLAPVDSAGVHAALARAFEQVDSDLHRAGAAARCGCTATAALAHRADGELTLYVANVGDSRAVIIGDGDAKRVPPPPPQQMKVTPQSFAKKVSIAFSPSASDVQETPRCFRKSSTDGVGFDTPRGQVSLRLEPLRDQAANMQCSVEKPGADTPKPKVTSFPRAFKALKIEESKPGEIVDQGSNDHGGDLVCLQKEFPRHRFFINPHPLNTPGHGVLVCIKKRVAGCLTDFHLEAAVPGKISYVMGWRSSGIPGVAAIRLPSVDVGIGLYRQQLIRLQSTLFSASLAADLIPGGFIFAFSDEGRSQVQSGTSTRGGTAHTRELNQRVGSLTELPQPHDTRRACQGAQIAGAARLDRVYISTHPSVLHDFAITGSTIGMPTNLKNPSDHVPVVATLDLHLSTSLSAVHPALSGIFDVGACALAGDAGLIARIANFKNALLDGEDTAIEQAASIPEHELQRRRARVQRNR